MEEYRARRAQCVSKEFGSNNLLTMVVEALAGTEDAVFLPNPFLIPADETVFIVNGQK